MRRIINKTCRIDEKMFKDLFGAGVVRIDKKLSKCTPKEMGMPKITNLATR